MAKLTYLDSSCLIAVADFELHRAAKVVTLLNDQRRLFIYSPFASLETLSQAIHYGNRTRERFFRNYFNRCTHLSGNLPEIIREAHRQSEKYGIVGLDACHIAAAIVGGADEFYAFEKPTKPMFRTKDLKVISLL